MPNLPRRKRATQPPRGGPGFTDAQAADEARKSRTARRNPCLSPRWLVGRP